MEAISGTVRGRGGFAAGQIVVTGTTQKSDALDTGGPPVVPFSAVTGEGVDAVWRTIEAWTEGR